MYARSNFVSAASVRQCFIFTIQRGTHGGTVSRRSEHPLEVSAASALPSRTRYTLADDPAGTWRMTEYTPLESQPPTPPVRSPNGGGDDDARYGAFDLVFLLTTGTVTVHWR